MSGFDLKKSGRCSNANALRFNIELILARWEYWELLPEISKYLSLTRLCLFWDVPPTMTKTADPPNLEG